MKNAILILILLTYYSKIKSQNYFKLIDLGIDDQHIVKGINDEQENKLQIFMAHICNDTAYCFSASNINIDKGTFNNYYVDSNNLHVGNSSPFIVEEERIIVASHSVQDNLDKLILTEFDHDFKKKDTYTFFENDSIYRYIVEDIVELNNSYYVLGDGKNIHTQIPYVHLIKLDSTLQNVVGMWHHTFGDKRTNCSGLKVTEDQNLAFVVNSDQFDSEEIDSNHVIKLDTLGNLIHNYSFRAGPGLNPLKLLALKSGDYVIQRNEDGPIGEVHLMDKENGLSKWKYLFPRDTILYNVPYQVYNYLEMNNGDILVCGRELNVFDPISGLGAAGFVLRLKPDGSKKWLKRFLINNEYYPEEKGLYHKSAITHLYEDNQSNIIFVGESHEIRTPIEQRNYQYMFYGKIDSSGCFNSSCDSITVLFRDKEYYNINDKWTYQNENVVSPSKQISSSEISIIEETQWKGELAYVIKPGRIHPQDYMVVKGSKVYFWDYDLNSYQLSYDFDALNEYTFKYYNNHYGSIDSCTAKVDSVSFTHVENDSVRTQYLSISCENRSNYNMVVYEGIGTNYDHPNYSKEEVIADVTNYRTTLRCYESNSNLIKFVPYSCDSTWLITSVNDINANEDLIKLYPNPSNSVMTISSDFIIHDIAIYSLHGELVLKTTVDSSISEFNISKLPAGSYFIQVSLLTLGQPVYSMIIKY